MAKVTIYSCSFGCTLCVNNSVYLVLLIHNWILLLFRIQPYIAPGAFEPPEGQKERPTLHYSVERHLILNDCDTSLIWISGVVVASSVVFIANSHRVYVYSTLRVQARGNIASYPGHFLRGRKKRPGAICWRMRNIFRKISVK